MTSTSESTTSVDTFTVPEHLQPFYVEPTPREVWEKLETAERHHYWDFKNLVEEPTLEGALDYMRALHLAMAQDRYDSAEAQRQHDAQNTRPCVSCGAPTRERLVRTELVDLFPIGVGFLHWECSEDLAALRQIQRIEARRAQLEQVLATLEKR